MLLVVDVGNTNIVFGAFDGDSLVGRWRLGTSVERTSDEYAMMMRNLFRQEGLEPKEVNDAIISNVVPPVQRAIEEATRQIAGRSPLMVEPGIRTGMPILYDNPREVGADRIVNSVAAFELFHQGLIVLDFGTATTFDCVTPKGEYLGGAIAPGVMISMEALFLRASKLPRVEFRKPQSVIGKNTIESIQSGLVFGYTGLVNEIVAAMRRELSFPTRCIATGGLADSLASETAVIEEVVPDLTLIGLKIIHQRNRQG